MIEGLNSVLESPPTLDLTQDEIPRPKKPAAGFTVVATMQLEGKISEALQNRFVVIPMEPEANPKKLAEVLAKSCLLDPSMGTLQGEYQGEILQLVRYERCLARLQCTAAPPLREQIYALCPILTLCECNALPEGIGVLLQEYVRVFLGQSPQQNKDGWPWAESEFLMTEQRLGVIALVCTGVICGLPLLLEGPPSVGKTALVRVLATSCKMFTTDTASSSTSPWSDLKVVCNSANTTLEDYIGTYLLSGYSAEFKPGPFYQAIRDGTPFLADEINLAPANVLAFLVPVLENRTRMYFPSIAQHLVVHPNFRFFATQNPLGCTGRKNLPAAVLSRCLRIICPAFSHEEMVKILVCRLSTYLTSERPAMFAKDMLDMVSWDQDSEMTLRQFIRWIARVRLLALSV